MRYRVEIDDGPDGLGRHDFTLLWEDPSEFRAQIHPGDGKPVGHRRGQCFRAKLEQTIDRLVAVGHEVEVFRDGRRTMFFEAGAGT